MKTFLRLEQWYAMVHMESNMVPICSYDNIHAYIKIYIHIYIYMCAYTYLYVVERLCPSLCVVQTQYTNPIQIPYPY